MAAARLLFDASGYAVRVLITEAEGSTPREVGAEMWVNAEQSVGTIGGGQLEFQAIGHAREVLKTGKARKDSYPLGPSLGQCCGGRVRLSTERWDVARFDQAMENATDTKRPQVWIYGAGHVGRALINALLPLDRLDIFWVDIDQGRFPEARPEGVHILVAQNPASVVGYAPNQAIHYVMSHDHALDLAICDALLDHRFAYAGLIGSKTKWQKFDRRLCEMGHDPKQVARIICPIGDPCLGKQPEVIAVGVVCNILRTLAKDTESAPVLRIVEKAILV